MTLPGGPLEVPDGLTRWLNLFTAAGVFTLIAGLYFDSSRLWPNLLLLSFLMICVSLAGTVFIALQYVTGASWSVALRRIAEAAAALLPLGGAGMLIILFLHPQIYPWAEGSHESMPHFRALWLDLTFFRVRAVVYLLLWTFFTAGLLRGSRQQDEDGLPSHSRRNVRLSAAFLFVFGITFWLASFDWIMSVEPGWYSTIFGFYNFAGLFLAGLCVITLAATWMSLRKPMQEVITPSHLHDLGKLLFAFSTFWMYLWFSQFMLIWYANIPEESVYFVTRLHGLWRPLFYLNVAVNWVVPFLVLLPRTHKMRPGLLARVALLLLVGRWLDLYLMILPPYLGPKPAIGLWEIGLALGAVGIFGRAFFTAFRSAPAVPWHDPGLEESLHYHT